MSNMDAVIRAGNVAAGVIKQHVFHYDKSNGTDITITKVDVITFWALFCSKQSIEAVIMLLNFFK